MNLICKRCAIAGYLIDLKKLRSQWPAQSYDTCRHCFLPMETRSGSMRIISVYGSQQS